MVHARKVFEMCSFFSINSTIPVVNFAQPNPKNILRGAMLLYILYSKLQAAEQVPKILAHIRK